MKSRRALERYERAYLRAVEDGISTRAPSHIPKAAADYAQNLVENDYPVIFDSAHFARIVSIDEKMLSWIAAQPEVFYTAFRLRKRSGGSRLIDAPGRELKMIQHWLQRHLTCRLPVHEAAHGFRCKRSIKTNAAPHAEAVLVAKYDIQDFFPSITEDVVFRIFRRAGYTRRVAYLLSSLTTRGGRLPQGAPTSPDLANVAAYRLDARLAGLAARHGMAYTRYADDLTFSGEGASSSVRRTIGYIIRDCGFVPNEKKTSLRRKSEQQKVTGVVVNDRLGWPRTTRRWLRQELYFLEKHGIDEHARRRGYESASYKEYIYGHVYALQQFHPADAAEALVTLNSLSWPY